MTILHNDYTVLFYFVFPQKDYFILYIYEHFLFVYVIFLIEFKIYWNLLRFPFICFLGNSMFLAQNSIFCKGFLLFP